MNAGTPTRIVTTGAALDALCAQLQRRERVALDTEFERRDTYFAKLALVQLTDGEAIHFVDPLALDSLDGLAALVADPAVTKVLHAGSEDLGILHEVLGVAPVNFEDTQILEAYVSGEFSLSYRDLVARHTGTRLDKDQTRSNWLRRPLSTAQLEYAAADVRYLLACHADQVARLQADDRLRWAHEDCERAVAAAMEPASAEDAYHGLVRGTRLNGRQRAFLLELCRWREAEARERDRPRSWILNNKVLVALAAGLGISGPPPLDEVPPRTARRAGATLAALADAARALPQTALPEAPPPRPPPALQKLYKTLQAEAAAAAERLGIAPELLARRRWIEGFVRYAQGGWHAACPEVYRGWRHAVIGERLEALAREGLARAGLGPANDAGAS